MFGSDIVLSLFYFLFLFYVYLFFLKYKLKIYLCSLIFKIFKNKNMVAMVGVEMEIMEELVVVVVVVR